MQPKPKLIHCRKINYNIQSTLVIESMAESDDVGLSQRRWLLGRWFVFNGTARRGAGAAQTALRIRHTFSNFTFECRSLSGSIGDRSSGAASTAAAAAVPLRCRRGDTRHRRCYVSLITALLMSRHVNRCK